MSVLKAGSRLRSAVCSTEVMVVAAPKEAAAEVCCGGAPLIAIGDSPSDGAKPDADHAEGTQIGKRYVNEAGDLEVLCTKPGEGSLSVGGVALTIKGAKPLPSSD